MRPTCLASCFDVVTLWDVLEHLHDLLNTLKETNQVLKDGGAILIVNTHRYWGQEYNDREECNDRDKTSFSWRHPHGL